MSQSISAAATALILAGLAFFATAHASGTTPSLSGTPPTSVVAGTQYSFTPTATDAERDKMTFSVANKPTWASFSAATGRLFGTPKTANVGTQSSIVISVSDGTSTRSLPAFAITVLAGNRAPAITGTPAATVVAGNAYCFRPTATDADGDTITFLIANKPAWASFSASTGELAGIPTRDQAGTYPSIVISASDGKASKALPAFAITVSPPLNQAPTIAGVPVTTVLAKAPYGFTPSASDPDGDLPTFSIANKPLWATFDTTTGALNGTPTATGTFSGIVITVSDGQASAALPAFTITVNPAPNTPPTISGTPTTSIDAGVSYYFRPSAADADGDTLTFSIANKPVWATFDTATGAITGTPADAQVGTSIVISVNDGQAVASLPAFAITVKLPRKANYGHYFSSRNADTVADLAMLCGQAGVSGVIWRRTWYEIEPQPGIYNFAPYDAALDAIAKSTNPQCQLWIFVEFKSFNDSSIKNPCPAYLQARSALNKGGLAYTCFMWEPVVADAYIKMMRAMAARYDANPRVEGFIFQESATSLSEEYSQDVADGGTYTPEAWRDALVNMVTQCGQAFRQSRCLAFLNFLRGRQAYLYDVSRALSAIPDNRGCMSGPDVLPDETPLYSTLNSAYEVLTRHRGCRSNSAQNDSFAIPGFNLDAVFNFAVRGTFGDFDQAYPRSSGLCVNSYLFWNHRVSRSPTGLNWLDALPVIAAYPHGPLWLDQCQGGGTAP